jgi:DNA-binding transcriptional LysR family regulator
MDLVDLSAFVRIAELKNISAAARTLKTPKSSISRSLVRLETQVGAALVERSTRTLRLTDAGALLYPHALRIINDVEEAQAAVEGFAGMPRGLLRINTSYAFAQELLAPMLPAFLKRYPDVRVALDADHRRIDMVAQETDLVIRIGQLEDSALVARKLPSVALWLCASPAYIEANGAPESPADLTRYALVHRELTARWTFGRDGVQETIEAQARFVTPDPGAQRVVLTGGFGVGRIPDYLAAPAIEAGQLVRLLADYRTPTIEIHAMYPSHRSLSAKVRVFIDALVEHMDPPAPSSP